MDHQNAARGLGGVSVIAEFWHAPEHLTHPGRYEKQPVAVNAAFVFNTSQIVFFRFTHSFPVSRNSNDLISLVPLWRRQETACRKL